MSYIFTVAISLTVFWLIGTILAQIDEDYAMYWAVGIVFWILKFLLYPWNASRKYDSSRAYYEKQGITKTQYIFGKRGARR